MEIIRAKHFILRPFKKGDEESLVKNINSKNIYRATLNIPYPYTMKDALQWIKKNEDLQKQTSRTSINFAIDIKGDIVGGIGLSYIESYKAEIGYWLTESYWGKGIVTKAIGKITQFGFEHLGLKRIYADVFSFNKASMRVLEKNDYQLEGILRKNVLKDDRLLDEYLYAKIVKG
ncbi:MAG: GNAT family N-acetyltransferase [Candidatus Levybacteria bacterium]|nr:GNAT family N-acetyltransferase [Candidatus Levybacteria bacterium]